MLQKLHRALSGYDNYSVSSKGARIAKVVLRSGALRKREKFWRDLLMEYQALRECPASCIGRTFGKYGRQASNIEHQFRKVAVRG